LATVGGDQASVYDNDHGVGTNIGHLDLMINYVNPGKKSELNACAWLGDLDTSSDGEEDTDTYLAVGGNDSLVQIISIARCRVICILRGHKSGVVDLAVHPQRVGYLLSVGADQTVRLWDCRDPYGEPEKSCLATFDANAIVASFSPIGDGFVTGGLGGCLRQWEIPGQCFDDTGKNKNVSHAITQCKVLSKKHRVDIDCIRAVGDHYISKDIEGKIVVWRITDEEAQEVLTIRVPDCRLNSRSRFDVSQDGDFLCAGNSAGIVFVYSLSEGKLVTKLQTGRSKHPANGCVFSSDCRHMALVCAEPFIYRWSLPDELPTQETAESN
jgi:WD40 repeat protein